VQQLKVVDGCPGGQALTVRRFCPVTPVDVLAVEVVSIYCTEWGVGALGWLMV